MVDPRMSGTGERPLETMYILASRSLQYYDEPSNTHQRLCQCLSKSFVLRYQVTIALDLSNSEWNVSHFENLNEYMKEIGELFLLLNSAHNIFFHLIFSPCLYNIQTIHVSYTGWGPLKFLVVIWFFIFCQNFCSTENDPLTFYSCWYWQRW